jgi:hypothetical protein
LGVRRPRDVGGARRRRRALEVSGRRNGWENEWKRNRLGEASRSGERRPGDAGGLRRRRRAVDRSGIKYKVGNWYKRVTVVYVDTLHD